GRGLNTASQRLQPLVRALLRPHQPRVAGHIGGEDGSETAFDGLDHGLPSAMAIIAEPQPPVLRERATVSPAPLTCEHRHDRVPNGWGAAGLPILCFRPVQPGISREDAPLGSAGEMSNQNSATPTSADAVVE